MSASGMPEQGVEQRCQLIPGWRGELASDMDWIVCHAVELVVMEGRVSCPDVRARDVGHTTSVEDCLLCRHLIATPADRRPDGMCAIETEPQ